MHVFMDVLGWVGVAAVLGAYILVSIRRLAGDSVLYQVLNLVGGVFLMVNSYYYRAMPSVFVNLIWAGIAILAMVRVWAKKAK